MTGYFPRLMASTGITLSSPVRQESGLPSSGAAASVIEVDEFRTVAPAEIVTKPTEEPCAVVQPYSSDVTIAPRDETPLCNAPGEAAPAAQVFVHNAGQRLTDRKVGEQEAPSTPYLPSVAIDEARTVLKPAFSGIRSKVVSLQEPTAVEASQRAERAPGLTSVSEPHRGYDETEIQPSPPLNKSTDHTCLVIDVPPFLKEVREWVAAAPEGVEQPDCIALQTEPAIDGLPPSRPVLRDADKDPQRPGILESPGFELSIGEISIVVETPQAPPPRKELNPPGVTARCDIARSRLNRHYIRI